MTSAGLRIDLGRQQVFVDERSVYLTASQFKLLALLAEEPGHVVTRREIMQRLWDSDYAGDDHVCDVHVSNLRHKIERDPRIRSGSSRSAAWATSSSRPSLAIPQES